LTASLPHGVEVRVGAALRSVNVIELATTVQALKVMLADISEPLCVVLRNRIRLHHPNHAGAVAPPTTTPQFPHVAPTGTEATTTTQ
jgi:hypothetical protein